ncbi:MAG TPA: hypothetical protein VFZ09_49300 [Archangium sp.]|uniref:hypothetical protein n=1 Tax=Archangium sp. TaxID=1872627 RepID=UPI002E3404E2|nr:hypothetical protein [Archangium sp.]HEX5754278.1 hypothetical protein [Archangium sp.]
MIILELFLDGSFKEGFRGEDMSRRCCWMLLWLVGSAWGCSAPNPHVRVRRMEDGRLQVDGPLAGPFKTSEELATNACEIMTRQPGASNGAYGFEYCALHYYSGVENAFFLSYLSDIGGTKAGGRKFCELPSVVDDPEHRESIILGGAHSHPNNRQFSRGDLSGESLWRPTRLVDKRTGRVFDRQLLLLYREKNGECRAYGYNNTTRVVSALRGGEWVAIGQVGNDAGDIRMFEGQDWLP